ncbi:MAG: hypothetical protein IPP40_16170 [bacterium]|nr:hypothetical protein [bacterium]
MPDPPVLKRRTTRSRSGPKILGIPVLAMQWIKTIELEACRKDGTKLQVELSSASTILDGSHYAVGIVRDVSERNIRTESLGNST